MIKTDLLIDCNSLMSSTINKYLALSGGVGGAKLILGMHHVLEPGQLTVVVNTGDDFIYHGLYISPDIDTLIYTLADINNQQLGWGRRDETWNYMVACEQLGLETWFRLGDKDLAIHTLRTERLTQGAILSEVVCELCCRFGITTEIIPMSDDHVTTHVETNIGRLPFQDYFVKHVSQPQVLAVNFDGISKAEPSPRFNVLMKEVSVGGVIVCPSNPFLSIQPILELSGVRDMLTTMECPLLVVSPIVRGEALKGPTVKIMHELNIRCDVIGIAELYQGIANAIVIDCGDADYVSDIEALGMDVIVTNIIMRTLEDKISLAHRILSYFTSIQQGS